MKKIILLLAIFLFSCPVFAGDDLSFIYINGSNNNDKKMQDWYENGVKKLHPVLRKKFLKNSFIKKYYKNDGGLSIKEEPVIFFWGYNSKNDLDFVKKQLEISKMVSSSGAYWVRNLLTQFLHDAIWVQKPHNMIPVIEELNFKVKEEAAQGRGIVLYGYSAGTFVSYEYLFNKLRYLNIEKLFQALNVDDEILQFVKNNPRKDTCISALSYNYAGIGSVSGDGHLILNQDKQKLLENYLKIDEMTEAACAPEGKIYGVVNFASPLTLFYSDMADPNYEMTYYNKLMAKYIMENGIAMLTVNFKEDPLGFPTSRNLTIADVEKILDIKIENPTGIIYDNSGVWSRRIFPFAHTSYWTARRIFSNAVVKTYINGYKFQYNEKYQKKVLKRNSKKSEL